MNRTRKMNLRPTRPATKRFSSLRGLRWLAIAGVFLLLAPRAVASAEITEGSGDMVGVTYLCLDLQTLLQRSRGLR